MIRKFLPKLKFSKMLTKIAIFQNFSQIWYTVEPLWKGQESLTKVAKFGQFQCTILYKSCLFYPSWQATSFERPPFWVAFIEGFHCISKSLTSIKFSQTFWPKLRFSEIWTKIEIFKDFDQNRYFSKIFSKVRIFRMFDINWNFSKILTK